MGCSTPHPHGQIWAQDSLPLEIVKESDQQKNTLKEIRSAYCFSTLILGSYGTKMAHTWTRTF